MKSHLGKLCLLTLCITSAYAKDDVRVAYADKLLKSMAYIDNNQSQTWPGFHMTNTPIVTQLYDLNAEDLYAFNFNPVNPDWKPVEINGTTIYHLYEDPYEIYTDAPGFKMIDGQRTFILAVYIDMGAETSTINTIAQRFDQYEHFTGESKFPKVMTNTPLYGGMFQPEQVKLIYLELEALTAYLKASDAAQKEKNLKDAVAINQYRTSVLDPDYQLFEPYSSRNIGLSYYVAWKAQNLGSDENYTRVMDNTCDITTHPDLMEMERCAEADRFAFTTLAYGLGLDHINHQWKSEQNHKSVETLLKDLYRFSNEEAQTRVSNLIANSEYNYKLISDQVEGNLTPYIKEVTAAQEKYRQKKGVEIQFLVNKLNIDLKAKKQAAPANKTGDDDDLCYLINNKLVLCINYPFMAVEKRENQKYMVQLPYDNFYAFNDNIMPWCKFKLADDYMLVLDGKEISLGEFMQSKKYQSFSSMSIGHHNSSKLVKVKNMHGTIDARNETLVVKVTF